MLRLSLLFFSFLTLVIYSKDSGVDKVAVFQIVKGTVEVEYKGHKSSIKAKRGLWVKEGAIVHTKERSFARLRFIDKSLMNVAPKSKVAIESFKKDEPGMLNVLSGKIRSEVTKNYLNIDKSKSKLFLKNKSAVMGIRGTAFSFGATGITELYEGEVKIIANIDLPKNLNKSPSKLDSILNTKGLALRPGMGVSVVKGKIDFFKLPKQIPKNAKRSLSSLDPVLKSSSDGENLPTKKVIDGQLATVPEGTTEVVNSDDNLFGETKEVILPNGEKGDVKINNGETVITVKNPDQTSTKKVYIIKNSDRPVNFKSLKPQVINDSPREDEGRDPASLINLDDPINTDDQAVIQNDNPATLRSADQNNLLNGTELNGGSNLGISNDIIQQNFMKSNVNIRIQRDPTAAPAGGVNNP